MPCLTPIRIRLRKKTAGSHGGEYLANGGYAVVPCGKCPQCKLKRANAWVFRLQKQERDHSNSLFVTLTYDNNTVPVSDAGYLTLRKRDFQLFMKRLRFNTGRKTIKYYAVGEYGGTSWRPHYHAIMYDVTYEEIDAAWNLGGIFCGTVTGESIAYTTKYICKEKRVPAHSRDDRVPEFSLMSQGLGKCYLTNEMVKWHKSNMASYAVQPGGIQIPLPRYYRNRIFNEDEIKVLNLVAQDKHKELFDQRVKDAGGVLEFYRIQFDHIRQLLEIHKQRERNNRNKI